MTIQFHPSIKYIVLIVLLFLIGLLIKGCHQNRQAIAFNKDLKIANDSLAAEVIKGKVELLENKRDYDIKLEVANGQVELKDNQLTKTGDELEAANKRINILLANHHDISPNPDTSVTTVPNAYIEECSGCFNELQNGQQLVKKYKSDVEQLQWSYTKKDILQSQRIAQQEQEKSNLVKSLQDCMDISKAAQKAGAPHGQLYFSWGVQFAPLPKMAAIGLLYQNKHKLIYGAKGWFGAYGTMVEANMNMPLSFKRKLF